MRVVIEDVKHCDTKEIISSFTNRQPTQLTSEGGGVYVMTKVIYEAIAAINKLRESQVQFVCKSMEYQAAVIENAENK